MARIACRSAYETTYASEDRQPRHSRGFDAAPHAIRLPLAQSMSGGRDPSHKPNGIRGIDSPKSGRPGEFIDQHSVRKKSAEISVGAKSNHQRQSFESQCLCRSEPISSLLQHGSTSTRIRRDASPGTTDRGQELPTPFLKLRLWSCPRRRAHRPPGAAGRLVDPAESAKAADDLVEQLTDARDHLLRVRRGAIRELTVIDDHSRVAYVEAHDDETKETATAVLRNAVALFAERGVTVQRVLSDNGGAYRSFLWRDTCAQLGIVHKPTRPYRPQTNGKIERFHRTLVEGWAFNSSTTPSPPGSSPATPSASATRTSSPTSPPGRARVVASTSSPTPSSG